MYAFESPADKINLLFNNVRILQQQFILHTQLNRTGRLLCCVTVATPCSAVVGRLTRYTRAAHSHAHARVISENSIYTNSIHLYLHGLYCHLLRLDILSPKIWHGSSLSSFSSDALPDRHKPFLPLWSVACTLARLNRVFSS